MMAHWIGAAHDSGSSEACTLIERVAAVEQARGRSARTRRPPHVGAERPQALGHSASRTVRCKIWSPAALARVLTGAASIAGRCAGGRLGDDGDRPRAGEQRLERRERELGRAVEENLKREGVAGGVLAETFLLIFRLMRSRVIGSRGR